MVLGLFNLSPIGILFIGALIGLFLEKIKEKDATLTKWLRSWPISLGVGIFIAWILGDVNSTITNQDILSGVTLLITIFFLIYTYLKDKGKEIQEIRDSVNKLNGQVEVILAALKIKKK